MIPLKFIKRPQNEQAELVASYIEKLLEQTNATKIEQLDQWCIQNLTHCSKPCPFEQLIELPYKSLQDIKNQLDQLPEQRQLPDDLKVYMKTLYRIHVPRMDFVDMLGETVCPYCNRIYINRSEDYTVCQFDHFFDISTYPILAVSFYNLVPCCAVCNLIKKDNKLDYSPYDTDAKSADEMLEFDYQALNYAQMSGAEPPSEILIQCKNKKMKKNITVLELEKLYQIHVDEVQELIVKRRIYGEQYAAYLNSRYSDIGISVDQFIVGSYTEPEDYGKRPLSKMKTDISKKIKLL